MTGPKLDDSGRITLPKSDRREWRITEGDEVNVRVTGNNGSTQPVRDDVDGRGRIAIPVEKRETLDISEGDRVEVTVLGVRGGGYECDDCNGEFDLAKVLIIEGGDRVVCAGCSTPEDRIID